MKNIALNCDFVSDNGSGCGSGREATAVDPNSQYAVFDGFVRSSGNLLIRLRGPIAWVKCFEGVLIWATSYTLAICHILFVIAILSSISVNLVW